MVVCLFFLFIMLIYFGGISARITKEHNENFQKIIRLSDHNFWKAGSSNTSLECEEFISQETLMAQEISSYKKKNQYYYLISVISGVLFVMLSIYMSEWALLASLIGFAVIFRSFAENQIMDIFFDEILSAVMLVVLLLCSIVWILRYMGWSILK